MAAQNLVLQRFDAKIKKTKSFRTWFLLVREVGVEPINETEKHLI